MATLKEYLGSLVANITEARALSDIQSVKVARAYGKHDLLKHFSIPRMKIEDVELTVPIALEAVESKNAETYQPIDNIAFNTLVYRESLKSMEIESLPQVRSQNLKSKIAGLSRMLEKAILDGDDTTVAVTKFSESLMDVLEGIAKESKIKVPAFFTKKNLKESRENSVQGFFQKFVNEIQPRMEVAAIENLNIVPESHRLKEQKPENLIYIKMKISEDTMEWHHIENEKGGVASKLLPE